jgi:hypothetical protein
VFQSTPFFRWNVYVLPPFVIPPLEVVGTAVATSGMGVMFFFHPAELSVLPGAVG